MKGSDRRSFPAHPFQQHFCFTCSSLQPGSSLKLPTGQFLNGRPPVDERVRPKVNPVSPIPAAFLFYLLSLQTGSSMKLPTGQFLNGRPPVEERVRPNEVRSVPSAPPLRYYNPLFFKGLFSVCHRIRHNLPQTFPSISGFENYRNHLNKFTNMISISIT